MQPFIGRKQELEKLAMRYKKDTPHLVVVKGRRRIGKSRLIKEFASRNAPTQFLSFSGLAPQENMNAQTQRDHFASQLARFLNSPSFTFNDWTDAFDYLSLHLKKKDIVLFDEVSWMASSDPSFVSKLKAWWDKQETALFLVLCGSVSTWIEDNILKSTAFFGRINLTLTLNPLSIPESNHLIQTLGFKGSTYDVYKLLSILGGVPWYLEQIVSSMTADETIKQLCFEKDGLLVFEFERIFHDLFQGKGTTYKKILNTLKDGMKTLAQIRTDIGFAHSGTLSKLMEHLIIAGFIKKQVLWSFKTEKPLKQSLYRVSDPYMRFYLKVIEKNLSQIHLNAFSQQPLSRLTGFDAHMGLQLEYLLLKNRLILLEAMGISPMDVVCDGPYQQFKTARKPGVQIDYLVQTITKNIFVCEFKFKRRELGIDIIESMQSKIKALNIPKGYAAIPALFHIGGVSSSVATSPYFYRVIDISDFLDE